MDRRMTQRWITGALIAGMLVFSVLVLVQRLEGSSTVSSEQLQAWGVYLYPEPRELSEFALVDDQGQVFDNQRLQDKWTLAFFGFTRCPDVCPTGMATLKQFHTIMGGSPLAANTQVVLVSVDPEHDTPEVIGAYAKQFEPSFIGVTGEPSNIQTLAHQLHVVFEAQHRAGHGDHESHEGHEGHEGHVDILHSSQIVLFDPQGRLAGFFRAPHNAGDMWLAYQQIRM